MPCYHPLHAFRAPGGGIAFSRSGAYRDQPLTLPCGQCHGCRLERSRQWAVRIMHEAQLHEANCFLTLTYDQEHLPPDGSLNVEHWKLFAKRIRIALAREHPAEGVDGAKRQFRFFHCGEYGDETKRMHLHAAVFGQDFMADRTLWSTTNQEHKLYHSKRLDALWTHGRCLIGDLSFESAAYVARYIMKKQTGENAWGEYGCKIDLETGELTHRIKPPYTTMSRNPGIGATWIKKYMSDVYRRDEVIVNGHPTRPPKFYDQELAKVNPKLHRKIKALRAKEGKTHLENNTYTRLAIRETVSKAKTKMQNRSL